jgi:outer membrane protein assembly factor BamB
VLDLGEEVANSFAVGKDGGVYIVTVDAFYKLGADGANKPTVTWRSTYDRGTQKKPGQLSQGSGTTPTLMPGGLVAITDNADPRMHVQFYDVTDGKLVCQAAVFGDGESASDNSLVSVGDGVIVENNYGYSGPLRTLLGRTTPGGLARVDISRGECAVSWTSDEVAPTSVAKVSLANGLVYAYTKRHSWWGVNAWYLTAVDARTGRTVWAVRTGLGTLFNNHYSAITIAPNGSLYVATLAGMVRVRDRA